MDDREQEMASEVEGAISAWMDAQPRSLQGIIGISELGTCREKTRRKFLQMPETNTHLKLSAFVGTAVGKELEPALLENLWPDAILQADLSVDLPSGRFRLPGHPDIIRRDWGIVDGKTSDGYETVEKDGSNEQQLFQRDLYALAAAQSDLLDIPVEQALTANVFIDRSGNEERVVTTISEFSWENVYAAEEWLNDVVYAAEQGEEASKDKPRNWCESFCEYFHACRGLDTDVGGLIEHEETINAVELYVEGQQEAKAGEKKKSAAKKLLKGVRGNTPTHSVRWVFKDATTVETYTRKAHETIDIRPLRKE